MRLKQMILLQLISLYAFSCTENSSTEPEQTFFEIQGECGFVGKVNGTNAFISILAGENKAVAYVCNGDEQISEWFNVDIVDPTVLNIENEKGAKISAKFSEISYHGEFTSISGIRYSFSATPSTEKSAGIYRVMGDEADANEIKAGWILNSNGEEKGALIISFTFQQTLALPKSTIVINNTTYPVFRFLVKNPSSPVPPIPIPYPIVLSPDEQKKSFP